MSSVLGLPVAEAVRLLEVEGCAVRLKETRSRKGVNGNEARVVRERVLENGEIELMYSVFKTDHTYGG
ncbi:MAG TPA: hypothetical protein VN512_03355 [Clostridia bacterium]|nr:hypothetical protein [Clostridia bacterium]